MTTSTPTIGAHVIGFGGGAIVDDHERIGRPGEFWATRYEHGWTVYGFEFGAVISNVTRAKAEQVIAHFDQARTTTTRSAA